MLMLLLENSALIAPRINLPVGHIQRLCALTVSAITPTEASCEFFLAINHGATGVLWFTAEGQGHTPQNTSRYSGSTAHILSQNYPPDLPCCNIKFPTLTGTWNR
jgi:hypothetical protein